VVYKSDQSARRFCCGLGTGYASGTELTSTAWDGCACAAVQIDLLGYGRRLSGPRESCPDGCRKRLQHPGSLPYPQEEEPGGSHDSNPERPRESRDGPRRPLPLLKKLRWPCSSTGAHWTAKSPANGGELLGVGAQPRGFFFRVEKPSSTFWTYNSPTCGR